jgi:hypothetical protein
MSIKVVMRPSPHTGKIIFGSGVFALGLWIATALWVTGHRDEPTTLTFLREFVYLVPEFGAPVVAMFAMGFAHRAIARARSDPRSSAAMKLVAGTPSTAARILPVVGVFLLVLSFVGRVILIVSSPEPTRLRVLESLTNLSLWAGLLVFVLLAAGFAIRVNAMRRPPGDCEGERH